MNCNFSKKGGGGGHRHGADRQGERGVRGQEMQRMMEASKLTAVSRRSSCYTPWSIYKGEGKTRQDQPNISGVTRFQITQNKHCAV